MFQCVKIVRIWSYSDSHIPAFGLNAGRHSVSLLIQSESGKIRTRIIPNTDTLYTVFIVLEVEKLESFLVILSENFVEKNNFLRS